MKRASRDGFFTSAQLRIIVIGALVFLGFASIVAKLYWVQIRSGEEHRDRISRQSMRRIRIPARRGRIYSAELVPMADNKLEIRLVFYPGEMRVSSRRKLTVDYIFEASEAAAAAAGMPNPLNRERIARHLNTRPGLPITVFSDLDPRQMARVLEVLRPYRGVALEAGEARIYPCGRMASHLIGYVRNDDPRAADDRREFFYYIPDLVGRAGLERAFDSLPGDDAAAPPGLRGSPGYSLVQGDYLGFVNQTIIERIEPRNGNHAVLTLEVRAQQLAESLLGNQNGAFVLLDADNGDVLAAASSPRFDLGRFSPVIGRDYFNELNSDTRRPLFNRVLNGTYTPGSILKPLVAAAIIDSGLSPDEKIVCDGKTMIGDARVHCSAWQRGGHGELDLRGAIAHSCNDYFIEQGMRVGLDRIDDVLHSAGLGKPTGVELNEASGIFPSREEKRKRYGTEWNAYDTALLSIGQGIITITPLQAAVYIAAIANGGVIWQPHFVNRMIDDYGNAVYKREPVQRGRLAASPQALQAVRDGMKMVVELPDGSGSHARVDGLSISGKTGSAEVGPRDKRIIIAWFVCYVEHAGRRYAAAVMIEEGKSGGRSCAPLAASFFERYLPSTNEKSK
ncbi:MAG: penicillin-binding transpeptidase domain-containing protein [Victivallaceae bacterium]|nr:penicillin-binding transpeptidase domain-containing protein [Victivallaceae bacterium]